MKRFLPLVALLLAGTFLVFALVQPINSLLARGLIVGSLAVLVLCLFALTRSRRWARVMLPARAPDVARLRERYLAALPRYVDSPYVWGGERRTGIDCSGLPRKAMQDALLGKGLATLNGRLIRQALAQWWFDASAQALAAGYRDCVFPVHE